MQIFLSHSSLDRKFIEEKLIPFLKDHGVELWYSTIDIKTSEDWERAIAKGLKSADSILVVLSPNSVKSDWVRAETHWALENRKGRVIPVIVVSCDPGDLHLKLLLTQLIDLSESSEIEWSKLLNACRKKLNGASDSHISHSFQTSNQPPEISWTTSGNRIGLEYGVIQSYEHGVLLSYSFLQAFKDILKDSIVLDFANLIEFWPKDCLKAILRTHPGGDIFEEDMDYLLKEVHATVLQWMLNLTVSFDLLKSNDDSTLDFTEEFRDELSLLLTRKKNSDSNIISFIVNKVHQLSKASALAKGDDDDLHHIMATLYICMFMKSSGMVDKICAFLNSEAEDSNES